MTQYPNYYYPPAPINPRPTAVTVLAIIGIIWGALMLLCQGFGLLPMLLGDLAGPNPVLEEIRKDPVARTWSIVGPVIGLALGFVLIVGSIGALTLKPWGRHAMLLFAAVDVVLAIVNGVIAITVMNPITAKVMGGQFGQNTNVFAAAQHGGAIFGILVVLTFPICVLIFMTRPHVKAAFNAAGSGAGAYPPYQQQQPVGGYYPPQVPPGYYAPPPPPSSGNYPPPPASGSYGQ